MSSAKTPGRRATLKDVAAALGVSPATVSNAYNRPDQLSPALRGRILDTARDLGYLGPDPLARSLRRGQAGALGVLYADRLSYAFADPAAALFLQGVASATEEVGLNLLLLPNPASPDTVTSAAVDGFVIYCLPEGSSSLAAALARGVPCVLVDQLQAHERPAVRIDDEGGARLAAQHLLKLGHRRFGVLALELSLPRQRGPVSREREKGATFRPPLARLHGYRRALQEAGLSWPDAVRVLEVEENSPEAGEAAARELLESGHAPTALLAMSDQLALGALRAAHALGLRVPQDVSVVGFDDVPTAGALNLTTVHQPTVDKGRLAGELLLAQLAGETAASPPPLPTRLVVRGTTAQARQP